MDNKTCGRKVLAIDDDQDFCYAVTRIVSRLGHEVVTAATADEARKAAKAGDIDLILLDVGLPDGNGLDLLPGFKALEPSPEVVIITGAGDATGAELAINNGAWDYIEKSASARDISLTVSRVLQYRQERQRAMRIDQITSLKRENIIGSGPRMKKALDAVAAAAACEANVLISGETGTGKELFARAVHRNSGRAGHDLVIVDCASLPENLTENLLFGHKKGVYTGADANARGLIKMADGSSLFLDEIGELSLAMQKTLLRVVQEKRFRPLGGGEEVESDFRLIAATNRDLDAMVREGRFRKDLLYRVRSLHIDLPALRDRGQDTKELARYYLDWYCDRLGSGYKGISSDFLEVILAYDWPGNVRELAHAMEHAVIAALNDPTVFAAHLPKALRVKVVTSGLSRPAPAPVDEPYGPGPMPPLAEYRDSMLERIEKKYLSDLMDRSANVKAACGVSGLSRSRLYALLKKHGISSR